MSAVTGTAPPTSRPAPSTDRSSTLAAVVAGLTVAATLRGGAFHRLDAFVVGLVSLLIVGTVVRAKVDAAAKLVVVTVSAFAAWWLIRAIGHGTPTAFLPLGASLIAFLAAFLVSRELDRASRVTSVKAVVALGAGVSAIGLLAVALDWSPLALHSGASWRLASTLTYQNAAGLLLAMALLVAIGLDQTQWSIRLALCVCATGLVATQSRGALLALLAGVMFVPLAHFRRALLPLLAGLAAGALVVVMSADGRLHLLVVVPVLCGAAVSVVVRKRDEPMVRVPDIARVVTALLAAGLGAGAVWFVVHPARTHLVASPGNDMRITIWRSALAEWRSSPLLGVGPDHLLRLHSSVLIAGSTASFVHNEYLQVLADGGLIAAVLLVAVGVAVVRSVRRNSVMASCAVAALVAFAVAGGVDFDWHLPALALLGGWVAGLAGGESS